MRLEQLQQIVEIEKRQSISKAAKALYMGQPALSGSLNSFEDEIGMRIFERSASGVIPTAEGREILCLAHQVLDSCTQILNYSKQQHELYGKVTVLVARSHSFLLSDLMLAFKDHFPKAELELQVETVGKIIESVAQGTTNLGLIFAWNTQEELVASLKQQKLQHEIFSNRSVLFYVGQNSPYAKKESVTLEEIRREKFVTFSLDAWIIVNKQLQAESEPLLMTEIESLKRIVSKGEAVAILPDTIISHDLYCEHGLIRPIPIRDIEQSGQGGDYLIYPEKRQLTLLEQRTLDLMREILSQNKNK